MEAGNFKSSVLTFPCSPHESSSSFIIRNIVDFVERQEHFDSFTIIALSHVMKSSSPIAVCSSEIRISLQ